MRTLKKHGWVAVVVAVIVVVAVDVGESVAQPNAAMSTIPNVLVVPGGSFTYSVTIRNALGAPMPFLPVTLVWPPAALAMTCVCPGSAVPMVPGVTDGLGVARFNIAAGGCINPATAGTGVNVIAGGMFLVAVGQVSPDLVNGPGLPMPDCAVGLSDAVAVTLPLMTATYTFCTDLNSDMQTSLTDAVILAPALARGLRCP